MKSPIQSPPSGRAVIIPATLVAALIAAPMLAFSQTSPAPGSTATPPPAASPAAPGTPPSGSSSTLTPGAPAARPGTTTTQAPTPGVTPAPGTTVPGTSGTTTTQTPATPAQPRTAAPMGTTGQAGTATTAAPTAGTPTNRASRIIGANVLNERNETVGEIEDLIVATGAAPMAVLSVGGFLGIGARLVAVPLSELRYNAERERWVLNGATKESLQARPAYTYQRS